MQDPALVIGFWVRTFTHMGLETFKKNVIIIAKLEAESEDREVAR